MRIENYFQVSMCLAVSRLAPQRLLLTVAAKSRACISSVALNSGKHSVPVSKVLFSSESQEWSTPQDLFDDLNRMFGPFELDVCATIHNAKCRRYYTKPENGLTQPWAQRSWMNPPYGRTIGEWIQKAHEE